MTERSLSFGTDAAAYERFRLGYPERVADLVLAYAAAPVRTALEVGAGTGKATRLIAGRGVEVTACEPDPAMGAVLRETTCGLPVRLVESTFEALPVETPFDLLVSAAAWHWTDPATRWDLAARQVRLGGALAFVGTHAQESLADPALEAAYDAVVSAVVPDDQQRPDSPSGLAWPVAEIEDDVRFGEIEEHVVERRLELTREQLVGRLATVSAVIMLPAEAREGLLAQVGEVLPDRCEAVSDLRLHLARRTEHPA